MHDFVAHVLRQYYAQTDWSPYNSYLFLTHSSQAVLDFSIPNGLSLSISASPSPPFFTTYRLRALPTLTGALGYIFASIEDEEGRPQPLRLGGSSRDIRIKGIVERFRIPDSPRRPPGKRPIWHHGRRLDRRDYLLYGCLHIPTARVDALVAARLAPTWQLLATAISVPPKNALGLSGSSSHNAYSSSSSSAGAGAGSGDKSNESSAPAQQQPIIVAGPPPGSTNLHVNLQHDTGRWFTEYSCSVDDGLLGFRVLHNLGHVDLPSSDGEVGNGNVNRRGNESNSKVQRVEDDAGQDGVAGGGLQGRFSVGAEVFFSPLEKSAGLSTGVRFTTLPETTLANTATIGGSTLTGAASETAPASQPLQPPTIITATLNPMMGHLSTAYAAQMTRDIVACSRFDFNVYSYESELTLGAEYWLRTNALAAAVTSKLPAEEAQSTDVSPAVAVERRLNARNQDGLSLRDFQPALRAASSPERLMERTWSLRDIDAAAITAAPAEKRRDGPTTAPVAPVSPPSSIFGVLKARVSTSGIAALLWEGRLRNCLVSLGLRGDLSAFDGVGGLGTNQTPFRGVGIDVMYFSQNGQ